MTSHRGYIQVIRDSDNSFIGYVSKNSVANSYLREEPGVGSALIVDFSVPISATTTIQIEISTEVSNDNIFPDVARKSLMPFSESRYWIQFAQPYPRTGRCRQHYSTGKLPVGPCSYPLILTSRTHFHHHALFPLRYGYLGGSAHSKILQ